MSFNKLKFGNCCDPCNPCNKCNRFSRTKKSRKSRCCDPCNPCFRCKKSKKSYNCCDPCNPCDKCKKSKDPCKCNKCCPVTCVNGPCGCISLSLTKTASPTTYSTLGEQITYTYSITNTGTGYLNSPLQIQDSALGIISIGFTMLLPGGNIQKQWTYTISASDLTQQSITNTAFVQTCICKKILISNTATATITNAQTPNGPNNGPNLFGSIDQINEGLLGVNMLINVFNSGPVNPEPFEIQKDLQLSQLQNSLKNLNLSQLQNIDSISNALENLGKNSGKGGTANNISVILNLPDKIGDIHPGNGVTIKGKIALINISKLETNSSAQFSIRYIAKGPPGDTYTAFGTILANKNINPNTNMFSTITM